MNLAKRAFACTATAIFSAAAAAGPTVEIDSEHMGAMGVSTALSVAQDAPNRHTYITQPIRRFTRLALSNLNAGTTYENLVASPSGMTFPCQSSGTLTARLKQPRVLQLEWEECGFINDGQPLSLDGPGEIVLLSDSLDASAVGGIRFGNVSADLVQTRDLDYPEYAIRGLYRRNLRMFGLIPLAEFALPGTEIAFSYGIKGFVDETQNYIFAEEGRPPNTYNYLYTLENLEYSGLTRTEENWSGNYDELRAHWGKLTFQRNEPYYGISVESEEFTGLRVTNRYNSDFTHELTIDGRVDKVYNPNYGEGCVNGTYAFKTRIPMKSELTSFFRFNTGELSINDSARARFYSAENTPPGLPMPVNGMLLNLEVRNVGTFNYDASNAGEAVLPITGCIS